MTARQKAVLNYVRRNGPVKQAEIAAAFDSTIRGVGVTLSALIWMDEPTVWSPSGDAGGAAERTWAARGSHPVRADRA